MVVPRRKHSKKQDQSSVSNIDDDSKLNITNKQENVSSLSTEKKIRKIAKGNESTKEVQTDTKMETSTVTTFTNKNKK